MKEMGKYQLIASGNEGRIKHRAAIVLHENRKNNLIIWEESETPGRVAMAVIQTTTFTTMIISVYLPSNPLNTNK